MWLLTAQWETKHHLEVDLGQELEQTLDQGLLLVVLGLPQVVLLVVPQDEAEGLQSQEGVPYLAGEEEANPVELVGVHLAPFLDVVLQAYQLVLHEFALHKCNPSDHIEVLHSCLVVLLVASPSALGIVGGA